MVRRMSKRFLLGALWVLILGNALFLFVRLGQSRDWFAVVAAERPGARFREVIEAVSRHYVDADAVQVDQLTERVLDDLLKSLDPHSEFLSRRQFEEVQSDLRSEFGGIGVQIELRNDRVVVIAPIAGSPGERAGIRRGDELIAVDGAPLEPPLMANAVQRLRGKPRTKVAVTLHRPATGEEIQLELQRDIIRVETVRTARLLEPGIGYIHLTQFTERTGAEFRQALERLESEGMQALVLDLRNNPGGLLTAAVEVVEPFFGRNELVVYTEGRTRASRQELRARAGGNGRALPVAVLINSGSASASEIVAGALRDTGRAALVGERTFGKGSVQSLLQLRDGSALRLTTAYYYTPGGRRIHEQGITPDIELPVPLEEESKLTLQRLRNDYDDAAEFADRFGFTPVADRQLEIALDLLRTALVLAPATPGNQGDKPARVAAAGEGTGRR
jgi:carboxyl-terminal processing protease